MSHKRPRGFCLCGTFSPSRRQIRFTRSLLTFHPISCSLIVIRRYPYRPYRLADGPGQRILVVPLRRLIALRAAWLVNQLARMTLARPAFHGMRHSGTPSLRASKFPRVMS